MHVATAMIIEPRSTVLLLLSVWIYTPAVVLRQTSKYCGKAVIHFAVQGKQDNIEIVGPSDREPTLGCQRMPSYYRRLYT